MRQSPRALFGKPSPRKQRSEKTRRQPAHRSRRSLLEILEHRELLTATAYTASMLVDANPSGNAIPVNGINVGSKLFFFTTADQNFESSTTASPDPASLWITDGTSKGTQQLTTDLTLVPPDLDFGFATTQFDVNGKLLFFASTFGGTGTAAYPQLWSSDGTATGTETLGNIQGTGLGSNVGPALVLGNDLYFLLYSPGQPYTQATLWESDGTPAGTRAVKDPANGNAVSVWTGDSSGVAASSLVGLGSTAFVQTLDGRLLSVSSDAATASLVDGSAVSPQAVGGKIVASADGEGLLVSDGTAAGTVMVYQPPSGSYVGQLFSSVGGSILFTVYDPSTTSEDLWITDGTSGGTKLLTTAPSKNTYIDFLANPTGSAAFFTFQTQGGSAFTDAQLWTTDGSTNGTIMVHDFPNDGIFERAALGSELLFSPSPGDNSGIGTLWVSNGTSAGTTQISNVSMANGGQTATIGGVLVFTAQTAAGDNFAVYRTDGTASGTFQLATGSAGFADLGSEVLIDQGSLLTTDGTTAGTLPVTGAAEFGYPVYNVNGTLLFAGVETNSIEPSILSPATSVTAASAGTLTATQGATLSGALATFTDPNGSDLETSLYSAGIQWGDGETSAGTVTFGTFSNGVVTFDVIGSHVYTDMTHSPFTVSVVIHRVGSPDADVNDTVDVTPPLPVHASAVGTLTATEGSSKGITVATFTDPAGAAALSDYSATLDWGDGTSTTAGTISGPDPKGVFTVTGSHSYADQQATTDTLTIVIGRSEFPSATVTDRVNVVEALSVANTQIEAQPNVPFSGAVATFVDLNGGQPLVDYSATIDWGDGSSVSSASISGPDTNGVFTISGSHTYTAAGTPTVTVTVHANGATPDVAVRDSVQVKAGNVTPYAASMLKDINTLPVTFSPYGLTSIGSEVYFAASEKGDGELWKTDGTDAGTSMVAQFGSAINYEGIVVAGDTLYFSVGDALWKSDGTASGTMQVATPSTAGFSELTPFGSRVAFVVTDSTGTSLWTSDGTAAGTGVLHEFSAGATIRNLINENGTLYFAISQASGETIWKTDGTTSGTVQVGSTSYSYVFGPVASGNSLYFIGNGALWQSDGTTTTQIETLSQPDGQIFAAGGSVFYVDEGNLYVASGTTNQATLIGDSTDLPSPYIFAAAGNMVFFTTTTSGLKGSLWSVRTDGTALTQLSDSNIDLNGTAGGVSGGTYFSLAGKLYFDSVDNHLWVSDGTTSGTQSLQSFASPAGAFTAVGNELFFVADDGVHGLQVWKSDGTASGAVMLSSSDVGTQDSSPGADPFYSNGGLDINGTMYFSAYSGTGTGDDLWKTDGTSAGTTRIAAGVSYLMSEGGFGLDTIDPTTLYNVNGHLVFESSDNAPGGADELWTSDGTAGGTGPLANVSGGDLTQAGNSGYFVVGADTGTTALWVTDGTAAGTHQVLSTGGPANISGNSLTVLNGRLYFLTADNSTDDVKLWTSDGTAPGTTVVADLGTWQLSTSGPVLETAGNRLFITNYPGISLAGPVWVSDGTPSGTLLLASSVNTDENGFSDFAPVAGGFVFGVLDANRDEQLWFTDGTMSGTNKLLALTTSPASLPEYDFTALGGEVVFRAQNSSTSQDLWETDGTAAGTHTLASFASVVDAGDRLPPFVALNGKLYFAADDGSHGTQLWVTDGTASGTRAVTDINATESAGGLGVENLRAIDGLLFFTGNDGVHGFEPWLSDGTAAGTTMIQDVNPGSGSSSPYNFTALGNQVFFAADDGTHGVEPWILTPQAQSLQPLVATGGLTIAAAVGLAVTGKTLATFTDPNGDLAASQYQATIDWGDGTSAVAGTVTGPDANGVFTVTGTNLYTEQTTAPETISVVIDRSGTPAVSVSDSVNVADAELNATRPTSQSLTAVANVTLTGAVANFTDPGGAQPLSDYSATINWGDGSSASVGTISGPDAKGAFTVTGSHLYTAAGTETATVTLHHNGVSTDVTLTEAVAVSGSVPGPLNYASSGGDVTVTAANGALEILAGTAVVASAPLAEVTAVTVTGADGVANSFTLDYSAGPFVVPGGITFNGGSLPATPSNSLSIVGGSFDTDTFNFSTAHNGSVQLGTNGQVVNYTNMTPLANSGTAQQVVFNLPGGTVAATLDAGATSGTLELVSGNGTFEATTFPAPSGSLAVDVGNGSDTVTTTSAFDAAYSGALTVQGAANTLPPRATAAGTLAAVEGVPLNAALATFSDPNGDTQLSDYSATIDWGDGGSASAGTLSGPNANGVFTISGSHTYTAGGTETATVTIHHTGVSPDVTVQDAVTVSQSGVNGSGATITGTPGTAISAATVATFSDGDGSQPASDFAATIDWGDGQTSAGTVSESGSTYSVVGSHTYAVAGVFPTKITVVEGGQSTVLNGDAAIGSAALASEKYVAAVFLDVLGRGVDPAGLQYWTGQLAAGMPISGVAQAIVHSAEYYAKFVIEPDYLKLLGRPADAAGIQFWTSQLQNGLTDQGLEAGFIATDEFYTKAGGTDKAWIDAAYQLLLGRPADAAGETFWEGELAGGMSRSQVAQGMAGSTENNTQLINDDYFHYLGRGADAGGLAYWLAAFANGETNEDVIAGFTGSTEYYDQQTSD